MTNFGTGISQSTFGTYCLCLEISWYLPLIEFFDPLNQKQFFFYSSKLARWWQPWQTPETNVLCWSILHRQTFGGGGNMCQLWARGPNGVVEVNRGTAEQYGVIRVFLFPIIWSILSFKKHAFASVTGLSVTVIFFIYMEPTRNTILSRKLP